MKQLNFFSQNRLCSFGILFFLFICSFSAMGADNPDGEDRNRFFSLTHPIEKINLPIHIKRVLQAAGINNIGDLLSKTEAELLNLINFDEQSLSKIKLWLVAMNLKLKKEKPTAPILARSIKNLYLSSGTQYDLRLSAQYLGDLLSKTETELWKVFENRLKEWLIAGLYTENQIQKIIHEYITEIKSVLAAMDLQLGMNIDWPSGKEKEKLVNELNKKNLASLIKTMNPILVRHIDSLELSTLTKNTLKSKGGIYYLGDLVSRTEEELRHIPVDEKKLTEVKAILAAMGLRLGMNIHWPSDLKHEKELVTKLNSSEDLIPTERLNPVFARFISDLVLSTHTKNAFGNIGIYYLGDLVRWTEEDLQRYRLSSRNSGYELGEKRLAEVKAMLAKMDLELGMNIDWPSDREKEEELVNRLGGIFHRSILTEKEVRVLKMRFGIGERRHTLKETAQVLNVGSPKVKKIQDRALGKLYHFGKLSEDQIIKNIGSLSDLTSEQIEMLLKEMDTKGLVDKTVLAEMNLKSGMKIPEESPDQEQAAELVKNSNDMDSSHNIQPSTVDLSVYVHHIDVLGLSLRTRNILVGETIYYIGDLVTRTDSELLKIPNFGKKNLDEVKTALEEMNLKVGMKTLDWYLYRPKSSEELDDQNIPLLAKIIEPEFIRSIDSLKLFIRTKGILRNEGIYYLGDLVRRTKGELLKTENLKEKNVIEIKEMLAEMGLELGMDIGWPSDRKQEAELVRRLNIIINQNVLTSEEAQVAKMRLGIQKNRRTLREAGRILNVSAAKIRKIEYKALRKLFRFGELTGRIKDVDYFQHLTSEHIEKLLKAMQPGISSEGNDRCSSALK